MSDPGFEEMFGDKDNFSSSPPTPADPYREEQKREAEQERVAYNKERSSQVLAFATSNPFSRMDGIGNFEAFERHVGKRREAAADIVDAVALGQIDGRILSGMDDQMVVNFKDVQRARAGKVARYETDATAFEENANVFELDLWWKRQSVERREFLQLAPDEFMVIASTPTGAEVMDVDSPWFKAVFPPKIIEELRVLSWDEQERLMGRYLGAFKRNMEQRELAFNPVGEDPNTYEKITRSMYDFGADLGKFSYHGALAVRDLVTSASGDQIEIDEFTGDPRMVEGVDAQHVGKAFEALGGAMQELVGPHGFIGTAHGAVPNPFGLKTAVSFLPLHMLQAADIAARGSMDALATAQVALSISGVDDEGNANFWVPSGIFEKSTWRDARGIVVGDEETEGITFFQAFALSLYTEDIQDPLEVAAAKQSTLYQWAPAIDIVLGFTRLDPLIGFGKLRAYTRARRYGITGDKLPNTSVGWAARADRPHVSKGLESMEGMTSDAIRNTWFKDVGNVGVHMANALSEAKTLAGRKLFARHFAGDESAWRQLRDAGETGAMELVAADILLAKERALRLETGGRVDTVLMEANSRSLTRALKLGYVEDVGILSKLPQAFIDDVNKIMSRDAMSLSSSKKLTEFPRPQRIRGQIVRTTSTNWYQNDWYTRPIRVFTDRLPQAVVPLDEAISIREFGRSFNGSRVPAGVRRELLARYSQEVTVSGRKALWIEGREVIRASIGRGKHRRVELLEDARVLGKERGGLAAERRFASNTDADRINNSEMILGDDGIWSTAPIMKSQLENYWYGRETAWIMKADSTLGRYRLRGQILLEAGADMTGAQFYARVMNSVEKLNRGYKTVLLLRPAWTLRVGMDEQARSWAKISNLVSGSLDNTGFWQVKRARRSTSMIRRRPQTYDITLPSGRRISIDPATSDQVLKARASSAGVGGMAHGTRASGTDPLGLRTLAKTREIGGQEIWKSVDLSKIDYADPKQLALATNRWERIANGQIRNDSLARQVLAGKTVDEILFWMDNDPTGIRYAAHADEIHYTRGPWVQRTVDEIEALIPIELRTTLLKRDLEFGELRSVLKDHELPNVHARVLSEALRGKVHDGVMPILEGAVEGSLAMLGSKASDWWQRHPTLNSLYYFEARRQMLLMERQIANADRLRTGALTLDTGEAVRLVVDELKTVDRQPIYSAALDDVAGGQYLDAENIHHAPFRPEQLDNARRLELEAKGYDAIYFADATGHSRDFYIPLKNAKLVDNTSDLERLSNTLSMDDVYRIERNAKEWALSEMKFTLYDLAESGQAAEILRLLIPFYNAWEEVITRWAGIAYTNPAIIGKAANIFRAPDALFRVVNEDGELVPWSEASSGGRIIIHIPDFIKNGIPGGALENMDDISFDKDGFSMLNNIIPLLGGPAQLLSVKLFLGDRPDIVERLSWLFPYGVDESWVKPFLPTWGREMYNFTQEDTQTHMAVVMAISQDMIIEHQKHAGDPDYVALTEQDTRDIMVTAKERGDDLFRLRAFTSLFAPAPTVYESTNKFYRDALRDARERYYEDPSALRDPETGEDRTPDIWFLDMYGEEYAILLESSSRSTHGMPASNEAFGKLEEFAPLLHKYPDLADLLLGGEGLIWSGSVYDWQFTHDERATRDFGEFVMSSELRLGWMEYNELQASWEAHRLMAPVYRVGRTTEENKAFAFQVQEIKDRHPIWADAYDAGGDRGFLDRQMRDFREIAYDPLMMGRVEWDGAREFIELLDLFDDQLLKIGAAHIGSTESHEFGLDEMWANELGDLLDDNPLFGGMFYRYFENQTPKAARAVERNRVSATEGPPATHEEVKAALAARQETE